MDKTASHRTQGFLSLFDMQTTYFNRALDGISDEDAYQRLNTPANHIAWLAGALVNQRFSMASEAQHDEVQTGGDLFADFKGLQTDAKYPTLEQYRSDWQKITPIARQQLIDIDDKKLDSDFDMGEMKMTYYDLLSFTIYREASILGQIALWRRLLNYPAMRYD